jgi:uncharacterized damage-inducible protein DinB
MKQMDTLTTIYSHNLWANLLILDQCSALTDEQLEDSIPGAYGSIIKTLRHIVRAEQAYLSRISTGQQYIFPEDTPPMTIPEMIETARKTGLGLIEWAPKISADDVVRIDWDGTATDVSKTIILTQVINHATEHRSQIMAIMTELGVEPPDLQSWAYFDEMDN